MARNRSHWFAFYADDYIAGTRDMTAQARGVYVDLLCYQFTHGDIPADDRKICRIAGIFPDEWEEVREEVLEKFDAQEGGKLRNHRMESEREKREEIRQKRIQAVNKRADRQPTSVASNGVTSVDTSEDTIGVTSTTTTTTTTTSTPPATPDDAVASSLSAFAEFWKFYPKKVGKGAAQKAWSKAKSKPPLAAILAAVEAQKASRQWTRDDGQFIPHPATWINQGRWDDETEIEPRDKYADGF